MVVAARLDVHAKTFQTHAASCEFYGMAMPVLAAIVAPHHGNCPDISVNEGRLAWKPPMGLIGLLYSAELGLRTKNLKLSSEKHSCILDLNAIRRGRGWHGDAHPPPHPQPSADHRLLTGVSRQRRHPNRSRLPASSVDAGFEWRHGWHKEMLLLRMRRLRAPRVAPIWAARAWAGMSLPIPAPKIVGCLPAVGLCLECLFPAADSVTTCRCYVLGSWEGGRALQL